MRSSIIKKKGKRIKKSKQKNKEVRKTGKANSDLRKSPTEHEDSTSDVDSDLSMKHLSESKKKDILPFEAETDSDEDSTPEDVSFSNSKLNALQLVNKIRSSVKSQKDAKRRDRQQKQDLYIAQKKQRLEALQDQRLSSDFLESLSETPQPRTDDNQSEDAKTDHVTEHLHLMEAEEGGEAESETALPEFIPISEDGSERVAALHPSVEFFSLPQQTATEFRREQLFGSSVRRQSVSALKATRVKRKARLKV